MPSTQKPKAGSWQVSQVVESPAHKSTAREKLATKHRSISEKLAQLLELAH